MAAVAAAIVVVGLAACKPPPLPAGVLPLDSYANTSCALTATGGVQCWGRGSAGQLGNGAAENSDVPVDVVGLSSGVKALAVGIQHVCALTDAGTVMCWGSNAYGELGLDLATPTSTVPVEVTALGSGVTSLSAEWSSTCAVIAGGAARCLGRGTSGQLGDGNSSSSATPVEPVGLSTGVASVHGGKFYNCALLTDATVRCWGNAPRVDGTAPQIVTTPQAVAGLTDVTTISTGQDHACVLTSGGAASCWGANDYGQTGSGSAGPFGPLLPVSGLTSGVTAIAASAWHTCAIKTNGSVHCWGRNDHGQLGDTTVVDSALPMAAPGVASGTRAIALGTRHTCALLNGGTVRCWGNNEYDQLGRGDDIHATPQPVHGVGSTLTSIDAGEYHTCGVNTDGAAVCWGEPADGRLGPGSGPDLGVPGVVAGLAPGVASVTAGDAHSCAVTNVGGVACWGANDSGQLGTGVTGGASDVAVDVVGLSSGVASVSAGASHTCAALTTGAMKCWGLNGSGQLGDGTTTSSPAPVDVTGLPTAVTSIATGQDHSCAATSTGSLHCWGGNTFGQLGNEPQAPSTTPAPVYGLSTGVTSVTAGRDHTCAIVSGAMKCWGIGGPQAFGLLGNDPSTGKTLPDDVAGLSAGVTDISAGTRNTCALVDEGAECWGWNRYSAAGVDTGTDLVLQPVDVTNMGSDVATIATGGWNSCALTTDGTAWCWGWDYWDGLGMDPVGEVAGGATFYDAKAPTP